MSLDEKEIAEVIKAKRDLGVSKRQGLREMGYSEDKINEQLADTEADEAAAAERAATLFTARPGSDGV
jgi:hypothetical protein